MSPSARKNGKVNSLREIAQQMGSYDGLESKLPFDWTKVFSCPSFHRVQGDFKHMYFKHGYPVGYSETKFFILYVQ